MKKFKFDVDQIRVQFPSHAKTVNGYPAAYLDGPGGTQVPLRVVEKINDYLYYHNANAHGRFATSQESDALYLAAKATFADFLHCSADEIAFGANTSSNNFRLAFGLLRGMKPGDEVLITDLDHEGNRSPWRTLEDFGIVVKSVAVDPQTCTLIKEDFAAKLSEKTKVVALNWAANSCGTITDVKQYIALAHGVGAITVVDAVHYAPHRWIDVKEIDTDILLCSSYKFFGPHLGVMYVRKEVGEKLNAVRVIADDNQEMPEKLETGTSAMELACGAAEAVEFIASTGEQYVADFADRLVGLTGRRRNIVAGMMAFEEYEDEMAAVLRKGLLEIAGLKIYGPGDGAPKTSTVSFTIDGVQAGDIAEFMAEKGLFVWDGDFYAIETINHVLKLEKEGGLVRIGLAPYNTISEIERVICAVQEFVDKG